MEHSTRGGIRWTRWLGFLALALGVGGGAFALFGLAVMRSVGEWEGAAYLIVSVPALTLAGIVAIAWLIALGVTFVARRRGRIAPSTVAGPSSRG